jgi:hypothetical protein
METSPPTHVLVEFRGKFGRYLEQTARCSADLSAKLAVSMAGLERNARTQPVLIPPYPLTEAVILRRS